MAHLDSSSHTPASATADVNTAISVNNSIDPRKCSNRSPLLACRGSLCTSGVFSIIVCFADDSEYTEFEIPAPFRRVVLNALTASPTAVDLRAQSPQFYLFAEKIMNLYLSVATLLMKITGYA